MKTSFFKVALSSIALACACSSAFSQVNDSKRAELNAMSPLMIGPTYTATFSHIANTYFTDTLSFNVPASLLQGAVFTVTSPDTIVGSLSAFLFSGVDPSGKTATPPVGCMPGCSLEGFSFLGRIDNGTSNWTSSLVTLSTPGNYFLTIAGNTSTALPTGGVYNASVVLSPIPEASGWLMLMSGLGVVGLVSRRRLQRSA